LKKARQLDFSIEDIKQLLANYESGPACGCGARPLLKTLIERKLKEIRDARDSLEALQGELQALYARTLALEGKTPAELMKAGQPTPSDAVFGGHNKRHGAD
jgi:DNA-binding transcriptional MerR regulator